MRRCCKQKNRASKNLSFKTYVDVSMTMKDAILDNGVATYTVSKFLGWAGAHSITMAVSQSLG